MEIKPEEPKVEKRYCSFCKACEDDAHIMIEGNGCYICDNCVVVCVDIIIARLASLRDKLKEIPKIIKMLEKLHGDSSEAV